MATALRLGLVELDTDASIIEAATKRVRRAVLRGSLASVGWLACRYASRVHSLGRKIEKNLSSVNVRTPEDRALLKDISLSLAQAAMALEETYQHAERHHVDRWPVFGPRLMSNLEDLVCTFEDISETAALGASEAFATAVAEELRRNLEHAATA